MAVIGPVSVESQRTVIRLLTQLSDGQRGFRDRPLLVVLVLERRVGSRRARRCGSRRRRLRRRLRSSVRARLWRIALVHLRELKLEPARKDDEARGATQNVGGLLYAVEFRDMLLQRLIRNPDLKAESFEKRVSDKT